MSSPTISRRFTAANQTWFAEVSGDKNPLHVDPSYAASTYPGKQVVHGAHALLWALDQFFLINPSSSSPRIKAAFFKPILLDEKVCLNFGKKNISLVVNHTVMAYVSLLNEDLSCSLPKDLVKSWDIGPQPFDHYFEDLNTSSGYFRLPDNLNLLKESFPNLANSAGSEIVASIAAISSLVGMVCPGLRSILSSIDICPSLTNPQPNVSELFFRVSRHSPPFARIEMDVNTLGCLAKVAAFSDRKPISQLTDSCITKLIKPNEFLGQSPLIIGSSGGLGLATARLIAGGGATPWLGVRDPSQASVIAKVLKKDSKSVVFDVNKPIEGVERLSQLGWQGRELYYFATPRIFRRRTQCFQVEDYTEYCFFYVEAFYDLVDKLMQFRPNNQLTIFYPSTTAINDSVDDLIEYRIAKEAGEQLCDHLCSSYPNLNIITVRLPRVITRQTQTYLHVPAEHPELVMAPIVKQVQAGHKA